MTEAVTLFVRHDSADVKTRRKIFTHGSQSLDIESARKRFLAELAETEEARLYFDDDDLDLLRAGKVLGHMDSGSPTSEANIYAAALKMIAEKNHNASLSEAKPDPAGSESLKPQ